MTSVRTTVLPIAGLDRADRAAWASLESAAMEPNPFFGPDMATAAALHLPLGRRDSVLLVRDGDELELALPLRRSRGYRHVPARTCRAWGHEHGYLDTPLVRGRDPERAWDAALEHLKAQGTQWLSFERLAADGPVRASLDAAAGRRGAALTALFETERPMLRRRPAPTYLEGRLSAQRRKRLRRAGRNLEAALGGPLLAADRAPDDFDAALERFLALEASGWKGREGTALLSTSAGAAFFRRTMTAAGRTGRAQIWELHAGDTVVAGLCAVVAGGGVFHLKTAYDEHHGHHSPGLQLEVAVVEAFHGDSALEWIDSCVSGTGESPSSLLYPDRRTMQSLIVSVGGAASRIAATALRRGLAWRASRGGARG